jgi:hypothetical protein
LTFVTLPGSLFLALICIGSSSGRGRDEARSSASRDGRVAWMLLHRQTRPMPY